MSESKCEVGFFFKTMKVLWDSVPAGRMAQVFPSTQQPPAELLRKLLVVSLDEDTADGPGECPVNDWLLPWGRSLGALWSIWTSVPDEAQALYLVQMAALHNAPLIIIITESKYFHAWVDAIGPIHSRAIHFVLEGDES